MRRFLVPLDSTPYTKVAIKFATHLAKTVDTEITGLVLVDEDAIRSSIGPVPPGAMVYADEEVKVKTEKERKKLEQLLAAFRNQCDEVKIAHQEILEKGNAELALERAALLEDLIIMGIKNAFTPEDSYSSSVLDYMLKGGVTPLLLVPPVGDDRYFNKNLNVLMTYNGSPTSAKAIKNFVNLGLKVDEVVVLTTGDDEKQAHYLLGEADRFLSRRKNIKSVRLEYRPGDIVDVVQANYEGWADIIVLGRHKQKGFWDMKSGTLSKYLLSREDVPLFLGC